MRIAAVLALALGAAGCKKNVDTPAPAVAPPPVNPIEVSLQIAAISPSTVDVGVPLTLEVIGSGIQQGAAVRVGDTFATSVRVQDENVLRADFGPLAAGVYDVAVQNPDANEAVRRGGLVVRASVVSVDTQRCGHVVLYFQTDAAGLDSTARTRLDELQDCYLATAGPIRIEGHADERGTTDYNLALGQRRAETVKQLLVSAGVPPSRLPVSSFGEERPANAGRGEQAWAENRRVELTVVQ